MTKIKQLIYILHVQCDSAGQLIYSTQEIHGPQLTAGLYSCTCIQILFIAQQVAKDG